MLGAALDEVAAGRPRVVLIEGEAGIGKTRLLDETLADARGRGMQVVSGRAGELEQTRPFGLVADAFGCVRSSPDPRRAAIAGLLVTGGTRELEPITVTSDPGLRFRAVDGFADLAEELALGGPLVIGVDDLQWADPSSLLTLGALARRLADLPVGLIGCLRPSPRRPELDRLVEALAAAGARQLTLPGLADAAVTELVAEVVAAEPGPQLLAEMSGAAGNPLFVTELLGALAQEGAITSLGGRAEVAAAALPPTLRLTILRRLSFLSEDTLQVLRSASILGSGFTLTDLSVTTARPALELSLVLAEGITGRVLEDDGDQLRFRHDLIRDAIYDDLPLSVRRALHREAGQRLAQAGAPALQVAEQLARGAGPGDAEAIGWLTRAARQAAPTSPDVAAQLLERAIGLMTPTDLTRDQLLVERASNLMRAGQVASASDVCRALLDRDHDPGADGRARICLGHALAVAGRTLDALRELERAATSPALNEKERASALGWASVAHRWTGDLDRSASAADQARSAAVRAGDHITLARAMASLAGVAELQGRLTDSLEILDDAVRLADESPSRQGHRFPLHASRALTLLHLDRLEEARTTLEAGERISDELGLGWHVPGYLMVRTAVRFVTGEWDDAIAEMDAKLADETEQAFVLIFGHSVSSLIRLHRNDLSGAKQAADTATRLVAETEVVYRAQSALLAHALILEGEGNVAEAFAALAGCWDECAQKGLILQYRMLGPDLVRLALAVGDHVRARDVAAEVAELANKNPGVNSIAVARLRCEGLVSGDAETLQAAVSVCSDARPLERALTCEDAGTAFARRGIASRARLLLEEAIGIYERLDAVRDIARAEAVLRSAGIRRGRRGARRRPQTGWRSLTPTEWSIAGLVAQGLSNPQIGERLYVSRRTVQTHLAHVFAKLDISSRAQLAAEVSQHAVASR